MEKNSKNTHFILVHGACHGGWCWYQLATLLKSAGYRVSTPDMAASGLDPRQAEDLKSISEYSEPLMELLSSLPQEKKVILVGHSFGGTVLSVAMERFPEKILVAVFATAFMPLPDNSYLVLINEYYRRLDSQMDNKFFFSNGEGNTPTSFVFEKEFMATNVYQLCPPEVLTLASSLVRPLFLLNDENVSKDVVLSNDKYGSVRRVYILCDQDMTIKEDFQRLMIQNNPPNEVIEIKGSDHMVMLCKPQELYACLQKIAKSYT